MDYIKGAVTHFLAIPDSQHAILLKGPWGCGKTFYYKKVLSPLIKSRDQIPCYISINGYSDTSQIGQQMLIETNPSIREMIPGALSETFNLLYSAGKAAGFISDTKFDIDPTKLFDLKKFVFIVDDLERSSIPIRDLFGYLNKFIEHSCLKFILIGNEEELIFNNFEDYKVITSEKPDEIACNTQVLNAYLWTFVHLCRPR